MNIVYLKNRVKKQEPQYKRGFLFLKKFVTLAWGKIKILDVGRPVFFKYQETPREAVRHCLVVAQAERGDEWNLTPTTAKLW